MPVRGQWLLSAAILKQWQDSPLESIFRDAWGATPALKNRNDCRPFNDSEARPVKEHPRPYLVYEEFDAIKIGHSSGTTPDTKIVYLDCPVGFRIYGSTKGQAAKYAELVKDLYGEEKRLTILQDRHFQTLHDVDRPIRVDDKTWIWLVSMRFRIEGDLKA